MRSLAVRSALAFVSGLLAVGVCASSAFAADEVEKYALESASVSLSSSQAGAHADLTIGFELTTNNSGETYAKTKDVEVHLPPGVVGNPQGIPRCTVAQLGNTAQESQCPQDSQVGVNRITVFDPISGTLTEPVYNMVPPGGDVVARFGFIAVDYPTFINVRVDPTDYSLVASIEGVSSGAGLISAESTLWGIPASSSHDDERLTPDEARKGIVPPLRKAGLPPAPLLSNPTACTTKRELTITARSYQLPNQPSSKTIPFPDIVGCGKLSFAPTFTAIPTNPEAFAPTGLDATLILPQNETPNGLGTSAMKSARVSLPEGVTINSAAGDGLVGCSAEQVGFGNPSPPACPEAAKIGTAEVEVPALEKTLHGAVYQRTPENGQLFRFWLVTDEQGVRLKLPARIEADKATGQVTTVFDGIDTLGGLPQVPVVEFRLHIFGGPRAPLATPGCGTYQTSYAFTPWSGNPAASGQTPMRITTGCGKGGFAPGLTAGTTDPVAGGFSPFTLTLTRQDGEANPRTISVHMPQGLLAKLGGVPLCPDAQALSGRCPLASRVGSLTAATGTGGAPLWIPQPGKDPTAAYLAGPYRGGSYSIVTVVPAQAGPFDLGLVVNRAAISVDPYNSTATITTDPLPQILEGVPVSYRTINVLIDRPEFTLNPTSCQPKQIRAAVAATNGAVAEPTAGFQATNCAKLGFKPKLQIKLKGGTRRAANPALTAVVRARPGDANIGAAKVTLPHSAFLDQSHIRTVCTRVQFNAGAGNGAACPAGSIYGKAKAITPLLDEPLSGPVYLRSSSHPLPDMVVALHGKIDVNLVGRIDTGKGGGIRSSFESVPDAPVSSFTLQMRGGKKGLIVNSTNLCASTNRAVAEFEGQNGKVRDFKPLVKPSGCKKKHTRKGTKHRQKRTP